VSGYWKRESVEQPFYEWLLEPSLGGDHKPSSWQDFNKRKDGLEWEYHSVENPEYAEITEFMHWNHAWEGERTNPPAVVSEVITTGRIIDFIICIIASLFTEPLKISTLY